MAEVAAEVTPCSNPGCNQAGTNQCSACKTTFYCCVICQTADWPQHKEECQGHLRKVGMANLAKANIFDDGQNWVQTLRYGEIAATKLKKLKDRRLETVEAINDALVCKFNALIFTARHSEAMDCIKECYTLWAMNHMRNPGSINAALLLIQSCILNNEYEDAERYARHAMFMIAEMTDNFIPSNQRSRFLADGSYWLARAILCMAEAGGIPPEEKQKAGEEAIELLHQALEVHTQLHGTENVDVAGDKVILADVLDYFNDVDNDQILRLYEQANATNRRFEGRSSLNVAAGENNLANAYLRRAARAQAANGLDRCAENLNLAMVHYHEALRIFLAINHVDKAFNALRSIAQVEEKMRQVGIASSSSSSSSSAAAAATRG